MDRLEPNIAPVVGLQVEVKKVVLAVVFEEGEGCVFEFLLLLMLLSIDIGIDTAAIHNHAEEMKEIALYCNMKYLPYTYQISRRLRTHLTGRSLPSHFPFAHEGGERVVAAASHLLSRPCC